MMQNYCEDMLLNVADEVNVKEVVLEKDGVFATYHYDTIKGENIGFKDGEYIMASLLFTGDIMKDMEIVRSIVKKGLQQRSEAKIKVRQPLQRITVLL